MSVLRRTFSSRAMKVHLVVFTIGGLSLAMLDWFQGSRTGATALGLDWAHMSILLWSPIFVAHAFASWFGSEIDDLDDETAERLIGRF